ncbi:MAG TPA: hypothetical protein VFZ61_06565 [Polyangiales bacterium]
MRVELRARRREGLAGPAAGHFGVPLLLGQLAKAMLGSDQDIHGLGELAARHGGELCRRGKPVAEVVHEYGDIRQAVNELMRDLELSVPAEQLWQLQSLLEDGLVCALTAYERTRSPAAGRSAARERGFDYDLRHLVQLARLAIESSRLDHDLDSSLIAGPLGRSIQGLIALLARRDARELHERTLADSSSDDGPLHEPPIDRGRAPHAP